MKKNVQKIIYNISLVLLLALIIVPSMAQKIKEQSMPVPNDTIACVIQRANNGDMIAQNTLGLWYYTGNNVSQDFHQAAKWWSKAGEQGHEEAIANLAICYQYGYGVKTDSLMAVKLYQQAIKKGNKNILIQHDKAAREEKSIFSARLLYDCYANGIGVQYDVDKAADYLSLLAMQGSEDEQYELALFFLNAEQADKAVPYLRQLQTKGHKRAIFYYGYLLFNGIGVSQDKPKGLELMEKAEVKGVTAAAYQLGKAFLEGDGVERDATRAVNYLSKVASNNNHAQWLLAECYRKGDGIDQNYYFAAQWYAECFKGRVKEMNEMLQEDNEGPFSQYLLGLRKYYCDKDYPGALECFKKVSKDRSREGKTMAGVTLACRENPIRNLSKAIKMFTKNTKLSPAAAYYLCSLYETGTGVGKNEGKAVELLKDAADRGVAYAQCKLGDRYMKGDGVPCDLTQSVKYYLMAEAQNLLLPESAKNLAECYRQKVFLLPDLDNASKRIEELGNKKPNNNLTEMLKELRQ